MSYKTQKLTPEELAKLTPEVRKEIEKLQEISDNYDPEFYDIFADNDARLDALAQEDLATSKKAAEKKVKAAATKPAEKSKPQENAKTAEKKTAEVKKAPKKEEPKEKVKSAPKSEKVKEEVKPEAKNPPKKEKAEPKPVVKKESPKPEAKKTEAAKPAKQYAHSWKRRISDSAFAAADSVKLTCGFRVLTAQKEGEVNVKTTFNKGDKLLVHEDGYPFAVMTKEAYDKRCKVTAKGKTPRQKAEPKAAEPKKPEVLRAILDNPSVPLLTWLDGEIELWKNRRTNRKITKIMVILATGKIVIEYTEFDRLLRVADLRYTYHEICPESTKLKKVLPPKRGTYRMLVTKKALNEQYSTNRNWEACQLWIREAYQCSRDGNCSKEQKELYGLYYNQCGDMRVKEENIAYLRWLHKKAGEGWKRGEESYLAAFGRVKRELRG